MRIYSEFLTLILKKTNIIPENHQKMIFMLRFKQTLYIHWKRSLTKQLLLYIENYLVYKMFSLLNGLHTSRYYSSHRYFL